MKCCHFAKTFGARSISSIRYKKNIGVGRFRISGGGARFRILGGGGGGGGGKGGPNSQ